MAGTGGCKATYDSGQQLGEKDTFYAQFLFLLLLAHTALRSCAFSRVFGPKSENIIRLRGEADLKILWG